MKAVHDKLLAEVMSDRLSLFMQHMPNERVVEYMQRSIEVESKRIWAAINYTTMYDEGFTADAERILREFLEAERPTPEPKPRRSWFRRKHS